MKDVFIILFFLVFLIATSSYGASGQGHEFKSNDCVLCHIDEKNDPPIIKSAVTDACLSCHLNFNLSFGHPTDSYPYRATMIPADMPLMQGKLTCLTCHYIHPKEGIDQNTFLRRPVSGTVFCIMCHANDQREHTIIGKAHPRDKKSDIRGSFDTLTKTCIDCHDRKITEQGRFFGFQTCASMVNHPVGVSYKGMDLKNIKKYRPSHMLHKSVSLYDGKIGCGTCHNIYSQLQYLLVLDNRGSRLCLECHIK